MILWVVAALVLMGWAVGANGAAGVFGTAVASRILRLTSAAILAALFAALGAYFEGSRGVHTYASVAGMSQDMAVLVTMTSGVLMSVLSLLGLPASASQVVVGAMTGMGLSQGHVNWSTLGSIALCWLATPVGGAAMAVAVYTLLGHVKTRLALPMLIEDRIIKIFIIISGSYTAYTFGANDIANVSGPLIASGALSMSEGLLWGGLAMAAGVITLGWRVMLTAGRKIVPLSGFGALVVLVSQGLTVHVFVSIGIPVSVTQAMVGAIVGLGLLKSEQTVNWSMLGRIVSAWMVTPTLAALTVFGIQTWIV